MKTDYDAIIIGGGMAGLSAAVYAGRAKMKTLILEKFACGGQILNTDDIENYPGFPEGIKGPNLSIFLQEQAEKFGSDIVYDEVIKLETDSDNKIARTEDGSYSAKSIIIANGGEHNKLGVPGEEALAGKGVSYCATCDGNFFANQSVVVIGGGDAAVDEGLYLTRMTKDVTIIHRRDKLRASNILQERAFSNPKVAFKLDSVVEEIRGEEQVDSVLLRDLASGDTSETSTNGVFIYIGYHPNSKFLEGVVDLDKGGHIITNLQMETSSKGIFACGDIRQYSDRQLGTAGGDGITAALSAYRYISEENK